MRWWSWLCRNAPRVVSRMPEPRDGVDMDYENNLVAAGAVLMLLQTSTSLALRTIEAVTDADGIATNQVDVSFTFLQSAYRITVERAQS